MLLGRLQEQRTLAQLLSDARAGRSGVLTVVGEPGIGKSALLDDAASTAGSMGVLRARGVPAEAQIPFAGLYELVRPALGCLDRIPEPQSAALQSALALRPARSEDRFAVGAATLSLLAAHAEERPLAVLIDDAHWLDGSSAGALLFAVRRLLAEPIAVVVAVRAGEPSFVDGLGLRSLQIEGLEADAARELIRQVVPHAADEVVERLRRETGGNPLALLELAREPLVELVPAAPVRARTTVAQAYLQRTSALPETTQRALVLAAVTDRGDLTLFARAAARLGVGTSDLDAAEEAQLVSTDAGALEFRHPIVRSAIYGAASPAQRRSVHRALAETLPDADADRRAWHLALAADGPDDTAAAALAQAARRARARSAYSVASQAAEHAARLATDDRRRAALFYDAADGAWLAGFADRAVALLDEAAVVARPDELLVRIDHLRGHIALFRGPLQAGIELLRSAAERAEPELAVVMLAEAVGGGFYAGDTRRMHDLGDRAAELAARTGDTRSAFFAGMAEGMALVVAGRPGAMVIRDAVELAERTGEFGDDLGRLPFASMGALWLREVGVGQEFLERAVATARSRAAVGVLPQQLTYLAIADAAGDRWAEAYAGFDEAIRLARETGQVIVLAAALARLALLEARLGLQERCREHAGEALAIAAEQGVGLAELWALTALRDLELALSDTQAAIERAEQLLAVTTQRQVADPDLSTVPELVELNLHAGRPEEAAGAAATFLAAAEAKGQPWALARAARTRALLETSDYEQLFEEALALHARTPDVFEHARTELAYGARLRRDGARVRARERLRAAHAAFDRLGARPWAEIARVELAASGEKARRREPSTIDELTPQELQISLLLAAGKTTRETAASLFLSPKTIEYHLRNAYRKLGVHSRSELREAIRTRQPGSPDSRRQPTLLGAE